MIGFQFRETMRGTYHMLDAPLDDRAIEFTIGAKVDGIRQFVKDKTATIEGEVVAEGFAERRPLRGTLGLKLLDERRLPYEFTFRADDGKDYLFRGQKDVSMIALAESMSILPASIYDKSGAELGRCTLRFDMRGDLVKFLKSWKMLFAGAPVLA
jgi:hypothetical protein